jgi:hypothetical protein
VPRLKRIDIDVDLHGIVLALSGTDKSYTRGGGGGGEDGSVVAGEIAIARLTADSLRGRLVKTPDVSEYEVTMQVRVVE